MKMEATYSSETSVDFQRNTRRYISEDRTLPFSSSPIQRRLLLPYLHYDHYYYYYYYYYGHMALCWALAAFSVGLLGRGISPSQGRYLHTEQHKRRINAHNTDIHALSGIRTHDPCVRATQDSSCLRPRGNCDRPLPPLLLLKHLGHNYRLLI
jgi:hypothetical protein